MSDKEKEQLREFYIFGDPMSTTLGKVRFLTYKEYLLHIQELSMLTMNTLHIYYEYKKMLDAKDEEAMKAVESIKDESLYSIVMQTKNFFEAYVKIFSLVFENQEMVVKTLDSEDAFMWYRDLVMDMNMLQEEEVAEDKKVQEFIEKSRRARQKNAEKQTLFDITSSIVVAANIPYEKLADMTVLQIYATYYRIGAMKSYDTTTLFATVSNDVKIDSWNRTIDLFERQTAGIKATEFNNTFGGLFK